VLGVVAFLVSVDLVGFFAAASGLLFVVLLRFGSSWLQAASIALLASAAVQLVFGGLLRVPLPRGLWLDG